MQKVLDKPKNRHNYKRGIKESMTKDQLIELGLQLPVVQGMSSMTDLNQIMKKMTPDKYLELAKAQASMTERYGVQDYSTLRDHLQLTKKQLVSFEKLPAELREYYKNDRFNFFDDLQANKNNAYYLEELTAKVLNDTSYQKRLQNYKKTEEHRKLQAEKREDTLVSKLAKAIKDTST